jgi:uncharacterized protein
MKTFAVRLLPDEDLKKKIAQTCKEQNIQAGCILSAVGSLKKLNIRLANSKKSLIMHENFEVLSLCGTVSAAGIHLHIAVANSDGQTLGGHLLDENIIYTTCELIIVELEDLRFSREHDEKTGFKEIIFTKTT